MPRATRVCTEYMHVIMRGVGKQSIFEEDADRRFFLNLLNKRKKKTQMTIWAYCLMENHVHIIFKDSNREISGLMHDLCECYAMYYNEKYERTGHLFQDRFLSENMLEIDYILRAFRYVLKNPEKAGICAASEYKWSSYKEFGKSGRITETDEISELIGGNAGFIEFMREDDNEEYLEYEGPKHNDEWARRKMKEILGVESGSEVKKLPNEERNTAICKLKGAKLSDRQIERLTGIPKSVVQRIWAVYRKR